MSTSPNPLYSPRKDTPSKTHGHRAVNVSRPDTLCLFFSLSLFLFLSPFFFASDAFSERSEGQSSADPYASPKLVGVRESADLFSSRGGSSSASSRLRDDDDERAQQTTLKVVCGLSRTRALCRSESPRECAPEGERVPPALPPLPPILSRPPSLPAVRGPFLARPSLPHLYRAPRRFPPFVLLRTAADSFASYSRSCGPP